MIAGSSPLRTSAYVWLAIKIGGRGQWRVERSQLEDYIQRCYAETKAFVQAHPLGRDGEPLPQEP